MHQVPYKLNHSLNYVMDCLNFMDIIAMIGMSDQS